MTLTKSELKTIEIILRTHRLNLINETLDPIYKEKIDDIKIMIKSTEYLANRVKSEIEVLS